MSDLSSDAALERNALRLAARALGELAAGPARPKHALVANVLEQLCELAAWRGAAVAERIPTSRNAAALRVLAAWGEANTAYARGAELAPESATLAEALRARVPVCEGARLLLPLCAHGEWVGALVATARGDAEAARSVAALAPFADALGALLLGFERSAVRARAEEDLLRSQRHLRRGAALDGLTGLATRVASQRGIDDAVARSHAAGLPLSVIVLDIDHAKPLADRVGTAGFDEALARTARTVHDTVRPSDWTGRWGIDAFVVVLLGCDAESASLVAERIRLRVEGATFSVWGGAEVALTVSAGVACTQLALEETAVLTARAQRAVEEAKSAGRNRVCVSRPART
jgi:diguanylate cyclase (GGDEF)-like protein